MITTAEISGILDDVDGELPTASAVVSRGTVTASKALRMAINEAGQLSMSGLERLAKANIWVMRAEFNPKIKVGDVLTVDDVPSFVVDAMTSCGNLISKAQVVFCEDTIVINGQNVPCQLGMVSQDIDMGLSGTSPDDSQGFFVPESIIPDGVTIEMQTPVTISGVHLTVEKISRDAKYGVLCVLCRRRGAE